MDNHHQLSFLLNKFPTKKLHEGHNDVDGEHAIKPCPILLGNWMLDHPLQGSLMMNLLVKSLGFNLLLLILGDCEAVILIIIVAAAAVLLGSDIL
jgi:hypothetical protein